MSCCRNLLVRVIRQYPKQDAPLVILLRRHVCIQIKTQKQKLQLWSIYTLADIALKMIYL